MVFKRVLALFHAKQLLDSRVGHSASLSTSPIPHQPLQVNVLPCLSQPTKYAVHSSWPRFAHHHVCTLLPGWIRGFPLPPAYGHPFHAPPTCWSIKGTDRHLGQRSSWTFLGYRDDFTAYASLQHLLHYVQDDAVHADYVQDKELAVEIDNGSIA